MDEVDRDVARQKFESGEQVALTRLGDNGRATFTATAAPAGTAIRVQRYDDAGSIIDVEDWKPVTGREELFLSSLVIYVYRDDVTKMQSQMDAVAHHTWKFQPDGCARCRERISGAAQMRTTEYRDVDVAGLWRPRPSFESLGDFAAQAPGVPS